MSLRPVFSGMRFLRQPVHQVWFGVGTFASPALTSNPASAASSFSPVRSTLASSRRSLAPSGDLNGHSANPAVNDIEHNLYHWNAFNNEHVYHDEHSGVLTAVDDVGDTIVYEDPTSFDLVQNYGYDPDAVY